MVKKNPSEDLSLKNRAAVRFLPGGEQYVKVVSVKGVARDDKDPIILGLKDSTKLNDGEIGLHILQVRTKGLVRLELYRGWKSYWSVNLITIFKFSFVQ